ncbi:MAG: hypothetical protein QOH65_1656 [Methylobacteriaceae bacterium]|jgi:hypothetical protein|nr:hypothetical protein [Methylobacteriaceae bacterium]
MTYCATFSDYAPFDRRPLIRDFLSQAGFAFVSVSFIAAVGACLVYGRPGGTVRVGKAPELAPIKTVARTPKGQPKLSVALRDVTFSLDFAPLSLAQSAPIATSFEPTTTATLVARAETKQVPLPAASAAVQTASSSTPVAESGAPISGSGPALARRIAQQTGATTPSTTPADPNFFEKVFGPKLAGSSEPSGSVLAYANPEDGILNRPKGLTGEPAPAIDQFTAIYDIAAHTVHMPDGTKLEAHSGLRDLLDDPKHVHVRMRGATPPGIYDLKLRERIFHGVQALRLTPLGDNKIFGRDGLLAHTYMLGPRGDSNGCVVFKNYNAFLQAFRNGEVKRLAVVARKD